MEKAFKCSEEFNPADKLNVHDQIQNPGVGQRKNKKAKCNVCGHEFSSRTCLIDHMRRHTGERPFKCRVSGCALTFKSLSSMTKHLIFKHSDDRPFKCDLSGCVRTFKDISHLNQHKKSHSDERPFVCPNDGCSFRAKFTSILRSHIKFVHSEAKPFSCNECDYKTPSNSHLKRHIMQRHLNIRNFKCSHPECQASFQSKSDLKRHFSNRHRERNFHCDHAGCGRNVSSARALNDHKRLAHGRKIHACPNSECNYRTNRASTLARHMLIHEGRNANIPCSVEGCEYKGKNIRVWKVHMRRHKTLLPCPVAGCGRHATTKEALKNHSILHNPSDRAFQCPLCFKHYPTLRSLQRHCVVHTNEKPFHCGHCKFETASQVNIKKHILSVHPAIEFPIVIHLPNDRECLRCKVILPSAEFLDHCKGHGSYVVTI